MTLGLSAVSFVHADDHEILQGSWLVSDARARLDDGPALDVSQDRGTMAFTGNDVTIHVPDDAELSVTFAFTLDTVASPHRIDLAQEGGTWAGIYQIAGDSLRIALPIEHETDRPVRPTDFGAPNTSTYILRRVKR